MLSFVVRNKHVMITISKCVTLQELVQHRNRTKIFGEEPKEAKVERQLLATSPFHNASRTE